MFFLERGRIKDICHHLFQIVVGSLFFAISLPLYLLIIPAIWIESGRPIFFIQDRVGKGGRIFRLIKLRTMEVGAEKHTGAHLVNQVNRVTRVGAILRNLKLDELPQLINILKREMNIVGPRPERPIIASKLMTILPEYYLRFQVRPGLTGPAQLYTPYDIPKIKRLPYDLQCVYRQSVWRDVKLIFVTMGYIVGKILESKQNDSDTSTCINIGPFIEHCKNSEKKIFIFQRDLMALMDVKKILRNEGHLFVSVNSNKELFAKAKEDNPDLIICELFLDNPTHLKLCNEMKNNPLTRNIPILNLTCSRRKEDMLVAGELGIDRYLTKPVTDHCLQEAIHDTLIMALMTN